MKYQTFTISIFSLFLLFSISSLAFAHPHDENILIDNHIHQPMTEYYPLPNTNYFNEKTSLTFHTPEDNTLPWAFVEGKIDNPVEGYPVIIQIYDDDEVIHFAQTEVKSDGTYEYKFRVFTVEPEKRLFLQNYPSLYNYEKTLNDYCSLEESDQDYHVDENILHYEELYDWDFEEIIEEYCEIPNTTKTIKLFDGDYNVTIYKVVYQNKGNFV